MRLPLPIPDQLPIGAHANEIEQAILDSQVVIVSGDTGSGKTTQLPKIALNAGRGRKGLIGCTQPRRLAAFTMAKRVASELNRELGGFVGCQHRFEKIVSAETRVKFMTDGILLAETRHDRLFRRYDTIIIDEAHERSLNIDFLLGILKRVLKKRRDLKLLISSATMDVERFSRFFERAPVISVPGRLYPIELRWRPPHDSDDADLSVKIADACDELISEGEGDILVFLPGEHDIRDATETLRGRRLAGTEIIPLLASLPAGEQARAFKLSSDRRIILSTNVAETSVTVPGIRYVIDTGLVRLNRYSHRTQVQRLLIEQVSQASADQRMGRCGRVAPGICIRLYAEDEFKKREEYTPPEILRTSLAGVILTMMDLHLGTIDNFPFIEPPSNAIIREGYRKLDLLGAIRPRHNDDEKSGWKLTSLGRRLPHLPVGPVLGASLFAADREKALRDTLIVAAALECDDPRRRPIDRKAQADTCHKRFLSPTSDFAALLRLWRWYIDNTRGLSQSRRRRLCSENYLSYPKMREWIDLHAQLRKVCRELKMDVNSHSGGEDGMHRALLRGLITNIGKRDPETGEYQGTRGVRFSIFPGSGLARLKEGNNASSKQHHRPGRRQLSRDWVVTGDLVETSRLFARQSACISPEWIESVAKQHCRYQYWAEHWDGRRGFASCRERVTFWGVVIADGRQRDLSRLDPEVARRIFIFEGLVNGDFPEPLPDFLRLNLERSGALIDAEARIRRTGEFFDPEAAAEFYETSIPGNICNVSGLRSWMKKAGNEDLKKLVMSDGDLPEPPHLKNDFPDYITIKGTRFRLSYYFEHGAEDDGLTCEVPAALLSVAAQWPAEWLVPGMLDDKLRWMMGVLPSKYRRLLKPVNETLAMCRSVMKPGQGSLAKSFADALYKVRSVRVPPDVWERDDWPDSLLARYLVYTEDGELLDTGRDISDLMRRYGDKSEEPLPSVGGDSWNMTGLNKWCFGDIPEKVDIGRSGWPVVNYPALIDEGGSVGMCLFAERTAALAAHREGVCRLFALVLGKAFKRYLQPMSLPRGASLYLLKIGQSSEQLGEEIGMAVLHCCFTEGQPPVRTQQDFESRMQARYPDLHRMYTQRTRAVAAVLQEASELESILDKVVLPRNTSDDIYEQLAWLVFPGFAKNVPWSVLEHFPRYLQACLRRIEKARTNPAGEQSRLDQLTPHWRLYTEFVAQEHPAHHDKQLLSEYRWLIEEFRVSLFAQELRTARPVSAKRLRKLWQNIFI
ncbi:MAG: ATP-dependent RNA helicase HrpA [Kiritimatiellia bacterium]